MKRLIAITLLLAQPLTAATIVTPPVAPKLLSRIAVAGMLYVDVRASDTCTSTATWTNRGVLGQFQSTGNPKFVGDVADTGIPGVQFNGTGDAYIGPRPVPALQGNGARSIEVWVYNPQIANEETLLLFGDPGRLGGKCAMNYGANLIFGACAQQGADYDLGWGESENVPFAAAWHHLVYTYNGDTTCCYYVDGQIRLIKNLPGPLKIAGDKTILIGAARANANSPGPSKFWFSGYINCIRVHGGVLTASQVATNFAAAPCLSISTAPTPTLLK